MKVKFLVERHRTQDSSEDTYSWSMIVYEEGIIYCSKLLSSDNYMDHSSCINDIDIVKDLLRPEVVDDPIE